MSTPEFTTAPKQERQLFNPDNLTKAVKALRGGNGLVALRFLEGSPLPENDGTPETAATLAKILQIRAEAHGVVGTVGSLELAAQDIRTALVLADSVEPNLRQIYEASIICSAAEIQRIHMGRLPIETIEEVESLVNRLNDTHPAKPVLNYYSQRTFAMARSGIPSVSKQHLVAAKQAAQTSSYPIPRDNLIELGDLTNAKMTLVNTIAPHPLSTLYELP